MTMFQNNWGYLSSLDYDFGDSLFGKDFGLLGADPSEFFLNPDDTNILRSIHWDCKQIESSGGSLSPSDVSETSEIQETPKYEIRNQDCMWSGSNSNSSTSNNISKNYRNEQSNLNCEIDLSIIKTECITENDYKTGNDPINDYTNVQNPQKVIPKPIHSSMQHIPPGTSLLRFNQQKKHSINNNNNINKVSIANVMTTDFLKERENITSTARPDTPLSLDDDTPEFKHTVDLSACVMGSNNICLETDEDKIIINNIKEQLEDMSTKNLDIRKIIPVKKNRSLSEVLHVIGNVENANNIINHQNINNTSVIQDSESDSDDGGSNISIIYSPTPTRQQVNYSVTHSDHSYTRSKDGGVDVVGLETPSDSDEEIDVVSIGDKKLPTNPSDKDRRALQTKVAHKISARIVKTPNGLKTIPPRRRCSIDILNNHSIITPTKSSATNSRYTSPISTPYNNGYSTANSVSSMSSSSSFSGGTTSSSTTNIKYSSNMRKRNNNSSMLSKDEYLPPSKRHRTKKQQQRSSTSNSNSNNNNNNNNSNSSSRRHYDADETDPDTIEKRNLHNDMERQRRIGLKNLFEALKKQIPSIQDKERAPKVNILREAAKLCEQLTRDEKLLIAQKQQLQLQLQRREGLLKSLKLSKTTTVQSGRFLE